MPHGRAASGRAAQDLKARGIRRPARARAGAFALHGRDIARDRLEPIAGNVNFVRASEPYATKLRGLCTWVSVQLS